ncbi:hypothetical protein FRC02_004748, partial [Tulasnella sp. 418]
MAGGPLAMWTSYLITIVFMSISCATLSELCSALPISGSLYIWASQAAGPKYGRFVGIIVAWWAACAWTTFTAVCSQASAYYVLSLVALYEVDFPGGVSNENVKWRAVVWIVSEGFLLAAVALNCLPTRWYRWVLRGAVWLICLDFFLCIIWLPIGASKTYGLRTGHEAFLTTNNDTGAPAGWNWILSFLFTAGTLLGFEAAGHVAEETKDARYVSLSTFTIIDDTPLLDPSSTVCALNMLRTVVVSGIGAFIALVIFLLSTPDIETMFSLNAPQPFVLIYSMALGRGGGTFMTVLAAVVIIFNTSAIVLTASRIIFAIARDGALPFSSW